MATTVIEWIEEGNRKPRTKARITVYPGWLGRLFGAKVRSSTVYRPEKENSWKFEVDDVDVDDSLRGILIYRAQWDQFPEMPPASARPKQLPKTTSKTKEGK